MKKIIYLLFLFINLFAFSTGQSWAKTVNIEVIHSSDNYHAGQTYPILFRMNIQDGWYIHGVGAGNGEIIPTSFVFNETPSLKVRDIRFPDPVKKKFDYLNEPIEIFSGEILVSATIAFSNDSPSGTQTIKGRLSYQACSLNACMPPEDVPVDLTFTLVSQASPTKEINNDLFLSIKSVKAAAKKEKDKFGSDKGLLLTLALIFLGGLALNLSPCIYPLIPVTVSYFGGKSGKMKGNPFIHGVLYLFGLSVTNSILGVTSALSGNMLGSMLQNPVVLIIVALIMTGLGLSFFDLWELRVPSALNQIASKNYGGYFGTFFIGLTMGIIAAPCIGPFVLGLLTYVGQKADPFFGFLCFFILSMGMGLPICILAIFSGAIERLPSSGDWMLWIRKLMGWVLLCMAAYMISPLIPGSIAKPVLFLILSLAAGIHLGWLEKAGQTRVRFVYIKRISGILIILLGTGYFYSSHSAKEGIAWTAYDKNILIKAAREGRPVILDFYADWCIPCRELDKAVFKDQQIMELGDKFITLRMDLTAKQPFQDEVLEKYQVIGVPTIIFLNKDGNEERDLRVESLVGKSEFLSAMKQVISLSH